MRAVCQVPDDCQSLVDYLRVFDITLKLMQDAAEPDAASPTSWPRTPTARTCATWKCATRRCCTPGAGLDYDEIVAAVQEGLDLARRQYGIVCGQIICGIRHISAESSLELADLAVRWKGRGVVGFDLAGRREGLSRPRTTSRPSTGC